MIINCIIYTNLNGESSDINRREFFKSYADAVQRIHELEKAYGEDSDFYFEPRAVFRLEYRTILDLIEQLNLLNTEEGKQKLIQL